MRVPSEWATWPESGIIHHLQDVTETQPAVVATCFAKHLASIRAVFCNGEELRTENGEDAPKTAVH